MSAVSDIFDRFEGPAKLGRALGKPTEHATAMKRRGSIPVRYWPSLITYAAQHSIAGIDYPSLVAAHARLKRVPASAESNSTEAA